MKKAIFIIAFLSGAAAYSQAVSDTLHVSYFDKADNMLPLKVDFTYYAKNYEKVFGEFNFTTDANNFGQKNVYVGYGDRFYYEGNSPHIVEALNPALYSLNFYNNLDVFGFYRGLKNILESEKDYSVKH